nr:unknown [uncultured bacterium]
MGTAPKLADQLDLPTVETIEQTAERATYRCRLRPGETRDKTAPHLRATIVLHRPTRTIESVELASVAEFSPTLGVRIAALKTCMNYCLPIGESPSLPQLVTTHVRGRAFLFKSLDADMVVTFSDYVNVRKK